MRADIESVYDWIREPENAEFFSYGELLEWVEKRPISLVLSAKHEIKSLANELEAQSTLITELVGALAHAIREAEANALYAINVSDGDAKTHDLLIANLANDKAVLTKAKDQTNDR